MRLLCLSICLATVLVTLPARGADFQDTQYGYTVSAPEFARPASGATIKRMMVLAPPDEGGFAANMGVLIQEISMTLDDYIKMSEKQFPAAGMKVRSKSKREVSGAPAVLFDYEGPMAGRNLRFLSLAVMLPSRVLLVTYTAPEESFGEFQAEFRRSLESFKLTRK